MPSYLWKWQAHSSRSEIPSYGEPGVAYWIEHEQRAYLWIGALRIMPVDVRPPADIGGDEMLPFEDQLDREERLRATALELAIQFAGKSSEPTHSSRDEQRTIADVAAPLHELADEFRKYIEDGLPAVDEDEEEEAGE